MIITRGESGRKGHGFQQVRGRPMNERKESGRYDWGEGGAPVMREGLRRWKRRWLGEPVLVQVIPIWSGLEEGCIMEGAGGGWEGPVSACQVIAAHVSTSLGLLNHLWQWLPPFTFAVILYPPLSYLTLAISPLPYQNALFERYYPLTLNYFLFTMNHGHLWTDNRHWILSIQCALHKIESPDCDDNPAHPRSSHCSHALFPDQPHSFPIVPNQLSSP